MQSPDPLYALQELDHITNKKPQLLLHVAQNLYGLLNSTSTQNRNISVNLVLRLLKYNPKASKDVLPSILAGLNSRNADIIESILDKLPDFVTIMQEHAKLILTRVFQLGVNSNTSAGINISRSISLLTLQSGS